MYFGMVVKKRRMCWEYEGRDVSLRLGGCQRRLPGR
jgi:hypothetical protein